MPTQSQQSAVKFLEETFEFEMCETCGQDWYAHSAIRISGNFFARCNKIDENLITAVDEAAIPQQMQPLTNDEIEEHQANPPLNATLGLQEEVTAQPPA